MKKRRNFAAAILLASMMAVSTCAATALTASAEAHTANCTHTLTIDQPNGDASVHTYTAYQIIKGKIEDDGSGSEVLVGLSWGDGVIPAKFVEELCKLDGTYFASLNTGTSSAPAYVIDVDKVAKLLTGYNGDVQALAKVFNTTGVLDTTKGTALTANNTTTAYTASGLADGWYAVLDTISTSAKTPNDATGKTNVRSANILQVVGDTTLTSKHGVPSLTKKIVEADGEKDANEANIGDTIHYKITVPVPDVTGYNKYFYIVNDTLSAGLTYAGNMSITGDMGTANDDKDDFTLTQDTDSHQEPALNNYYVTETPVTGGTALKIVFEDCLATFANKTGNITITYDAILNTNADATTTGNPNTAQLTYSNDPNHTYGGDPTDENDDGKPDNPDEPKPPTPGTPTDGDVMGFTPEDIVQTYTTTLKLLKVDGDDPAKTLAGAEFEITGTDINQVVVVSKTKFEEDANGTYYKLKDGTYTQTAPTDTTLDKYELKTGSTPDAQKYKMVTDTTSANAPMGNSANKITALVDADGQLILKGIGAGTYTIKETKAPAGYNLLTGSLEFTLSASNMTDTKPGSVTWTTKQGTTDTEYFKTADNCVEVTIENNKGTTLPSTGGIGTTIFYVVGGTLVAGAVVMLITKKRMSVSDQK